MQRYILTTLLKRVSRAFYLSVRVLPIGMREPVAIAYLLARAADTIADAPTLAQTQRLARLREFREIILKEASISDLSESLAELQPSDAERELLQTLPEVLALLDSLTAVDAERVRSVILTLVRGMQFDLTTFERNHADGIVALPTVERLDEYCYLVAGCVGEFWTDMSMAHTQSLSIWQAQEMRQLGARFGKALQMTNILRDMSRDLRAGRCYLPQTELIRAELAPDDLLDMSNYAKARPILNWGIRMSLCHFTAAERYILAIPRRNLRLRLAALWPLLIGLKTLAKLAESDDWLDPDKRIRIPRRAVYGIIALSLICGRSNFLIRLWIRRTAQRLECAIAD